MKTRDLVLIAFYVALTVVLDWINTIIPIIQMPNGGSLELALVALILASYHLGWRKGVIVALLSWFIAFLLGMHTYFLNFAQYQFDYIIPIGVMGLTSIMPTFTKNNKINITTSIIFVMVIKYLSHVTSGALFYAVYNDLPNGSLAGWIFSFGYNATYCVPTAICAICLVPILVDRLRIKTN